MGCGRLPFRNTHKWLAVVAAVIIVLLFMRNAFKTPRLKWTSTVVWKSPDFRWAASKGQDHGENQMCEMETCFDFVPCSLESNFPVFSYALEDTLVLDDFISKSVTKSLVWNSSVTQDPRKACVFLVLIGESKSRRMSGETLQNFLRSLPHWEADGRNHVLINFARSNSSTNYFENVDYGRAILVQTVFTGSFFRSSYDVIVPPIAENGSREAWSSLPLLAPLRRKYLISFWGKYIPTSQTQAQSEAEEFILTSLKTLNSTTTDSVINIQLSCFTANTVGLPTEWGLCGTVEDRKKTLYQSTFALVISPLNASLTSTFAFQTRLYEALQQGAIPVILGVMSSHLPFSELLDWDKAAVTLPLPRVRDLSTVLKSFADNDILQLRHQGRFLFETFFSSTSRILDTALAVLRARLRIPAPRVPDEPSIIFFKNSSDVLKTAGNRQGDVPKWDREQLWVPSDKFQWGHSQSLVRQSFNSPGSPFFLYPSTPFESPLPSEAKFWGSAYGLRPGPNDAFSPNFLGGNTPTEYFTVVIVTYKREKALIEALRRLRGLSFLHKAVVIWNDPTPPSPELHWPDIGVPLEVLKTKRNSMNNRYLPYDCIETEAVLNLDDDVAISQEQLLFAFRVWRENKETVVGFFGRLHVWDSRWHSWAYKMGAWGKGGVHELSFVIPSTSFVHKYYFYMYSYVMPHAIRDAVDRLMNCEDLAMAFLVAHLSRKPPVKVTVRWRRVCPDCQYTISGNSNHISERNYCLNFFTSVYGYMPLLFTQYAVHPVNDLN